MTATPPTFVAAYNTGYVSNSTPQTRTPTIAPNDTLVICAITGNDTTQVNTPTDDLTTHLTYSLKQTIQVTDYCFLRLWTAPVDAGQSGSFTMTLGRTATTEIWGFSVWRFSGVSAVGASNKANADVTSGGAVVSLTTQQENSCVVVFNADWNAADGSTRTWRTVNGNTPTVGNGNDKLNINASLVYTVYGALYSDAGAAGANNYGLTVPATQKYSIAAIELKGNIVTGGSGNFGSGFFDGI